MAIATPDMRRNTRMASKKERRQQKQQRRARKRKAQRAHPPSGEQILLKRAQKSEYLRGAQILVNSDDIEKMSDVILRFAEPLLKDPHGVISKNAIRFAIAVWNASLLPQDEQLKMLSTLIEMLPEDDQDGRRELVAGIHMLLARKQRYFADNTRVILDYQITEAPNKLNLNVISTLGKANPPAT